MKDPDCLFCKIVDGIIPSTRVLETDAWLGFLDIGPLAPGHTLLIPKLHCRDIRDLPSEAMGSLGKTLSDLSGAVMRATNATGLNVLQNTGASGGQLVFHLHIHLIPRVEGDRLGYRWNSGEYAEGVAELFRSKIVDELTR